MAVIPDKESTGCLVLFDSLDKFQPISNADIRKNLETKLIDYRKRMEEFQYQHPELRRRNEIYRDTRYKIFLIETMLTATESVSALDMAKAQMKEMGEHFDSYEFFQAWGVISHRLGTPVGGTILIEARQP